MIEYQMPHAIATFLVKPIEGDREKIYKSLVDRVDLLREIPYCPQRTDAIADLAVLAFRLSSSSEKKITAGQAADITTQLNALMGEQPINDTTYRDLKNGTYRAPHAHGT